MSGGLVSYGSFLFTNRDAYNENFANQQSKTVQLPGMDGAFDFYADGRAPSPVGKVTQSFTVIASSPEEMTEKLDEIRALQNYGSRGKLVFQPTRPGDPVRWTWGRLLTPKISINKTDVGLWQPVTLTFECPEPVFWVDTYVGWTYGDGSRYGPSLIWGGSGFDIDAFGDETDAVLPNDGNTSSIPNIIIGALSGQSFEDVAIQRLEGDFVEEEFIYTGLFNSGDTLDINGRAQTATFEGSAAWDDLFFDTPAFMHLLPGDNNIRVLIGDSGLAVPTISYDSSDNEFNGNYNNVSVGNGLGIYNGSNSYIDAIAAGFGTFFDGAAGTLVSKMTADSDVFADGIRRELFHVGVDVNNFISMSKTVGGGFNAEYSAGGVLKQQALPLVDDGNYVVGQTWETSEDEFKAYFAGLQIGVTGSSLGVWAGVPGNVFFGAYSAALYFWKGSISDLIIANQVADDADMALINTKLAAGTLKKSELNDIFGAGNWSWWQMNEGTQNARVSFIYRDSYR